MNEWEKFRVGDLSTKHNWVNPDCRPLTEVYHVCHFQTGLRIVEDETISADLVRDKSKLKTKRILVTWLSPNEWVNGYRYGNLRFTFDWRALIQGMQYFWVESIAYGIEAPRILVTERDHSGWLDVYDPTARDGPWWHDTSTDSHHWNGKYTLEIMLERDLTLTDCKQADFVDHHPTGCNLDWRKCSWRGKPKREFGPRFVAALVARRLPPDDLQLVQFDDAGKIDECDNPALLDACHWLWRPLTKPLSPQGSLSEDDPAAQPVARAVLAAYAGQSRADLRHLGDLFGSKQDVVDACSRAIAEHFGVPDWTELRRVV